MDFSGPFLEADLPEWIQEDRALTLVELRAWTECGEVTSPNAEDLLSFIKTQWSMSIEESLAKDKSRRGISDKERAAKLVESQAHMNKKVQCLETSVSRLMLSISYRKLFWTCEQGLSGAHPAC